MLHNLRRNFTSAVQQINHPIHKGVANRSHRKFFIVGTIPMACYDVTRGGSVIYDTEAQAIDALIAAGATDIQRADCTFAVKAGVAL